MFFSLRGRNKTRLPVFLNTKATLTSAAVRFYACLCGRVYEVLLYLHSPMFAKTGILFSSRVRLVRQQYLWEIFLRVERGERRVQDAVQRLRIDSLGFGLAAKFGASSRSQRCVWVGGV